MKFKPLFILPTIATVVAIGAAGLTILTGDKNVGYPVPSGNSVYFGVQLDTQHDSLGEYTKRLGNTPALIGRYVDFPFRQPEADEMEKEVSELAHSHTTFMLTLEPRDNLEAVNSAALVRLTNDLRRYNAMGVPVLVRFAHEMNGSWYPWAQNPSEYRTVFRQVADAVHKAPRSSILWAPNDGGGYPFAGGPFEAKPGSGAFSELDTNKDGKLTMADDPYAPYWPGDTYVDWVGLSLYHFGTQYPWGKNDIPSPTKVEDKLTGNYNYQGVDETAVPDFYDTYATKHNKPFAIAETGSFYNTSEKNGASEMDIKSAWWSQLFDKKFLDSHPKLKLIAWFEHKKAEKDTGSTLIDWRVTANPEIEKRFKAAMDSSITMAPIE